MTDSFICKHQKGTTCKLDLKKCTRKCSRRYDCTNCEYDLCTLSQEPCASCYFQSKESIRKYIIDKEAGRLK